MAKTNIDRSASRFLVFKDSPFTNEPKRHCERRAFRLYADLGD
jgi:hypothetical protein